ncbi:MAG: sugar-binding transcriptional regulator [Clostridiales bacterium]|nr:sugar-binding transcriptional regulator [Clostridiales bacterium]
MGEIKSYESMTVQEKWNMLALVSNLYYNSEMTQNQIADRLYISRSKVSRLLKEARELGIVEIYIREPWERNLDLEQRLKSTFSLSEVRVIAQKESDDENGFPKLAEAASYYLDAIVKPGMVVGISWGNTLYRIIKNISANNSKNIPITVVPIMGAANVNSPERDAMDLAKDLASAYGGKYHYVYAPLFVKDEKLRNQLIREENIKKVLELAGKADCIVTSVGSIIFKSWENFLTQNALENLERKGAVGHIGGHFYDINGNELETRIVKRMVGISLDDIKNCKNAICVAHGEQKAEAVLGALKGGFLDTLIIDEKCVERIFECL